METKDGKQAVYAPTRADWRAWLSENSAAGQPVWLILFKKHSTTPGVDRIGATEEALCFGWIDSLCKQRDAESYYLTFSPRNPKTSNWSKPNIERAERMIREGKMTEQGRRMIDLAKAQGRWHSGK
ncbi:MAG: hypothetical protein INR69_01350 [Mucilaginibacter polytrichastri]|nr:hypothetical protein [Mucilaginibacter polytrichastri]